MSEYDVAFTCIHVSLVPYRLRGLVSLQLFRMHDNVMRGKVSELRHMW